VHERCRAIGIEGYLTKPFKSEHLVKAIDKALQAAAAKK
jgi:CheY-like chemotaxis protein